MDVIDILYIYRVSDDVFICEAYNKELKGSTSDVYRELNSRKKSVRKFVKEYKRDIADAAKNADDIEWYLRSKGMQFEEEISKENFITPLLKPVINESVKKAMGVNIEDHKKHHHQSLGRGRRN